MRIVFVRHGHPNYKIDRLTELGHLQAEAAAERLVGEGIERIYASTCGRALETAEHTADKLGIPREEIVRCPFMREIHWGATDKTPLYENGHPWFTADRMAREGNALIDFAWQKHPLFEKSDRLHGEYRAVVERCDIWLAYLGYKREGNGYRVTKKNDQTVAMFSHAGSSSCVLSHVFTLPFPFVLSAFRIDFTAVTVVKLEGEEGDLVFPRFEIANDSRHIEGIRGERIAPQS